MRNVLPDLYNYTSTIKHPALALSYSSNILPYLARELPHHPDFATEFLRRVAHTYFLGLQSYLNLL